MSERSDIPEVATGHLLEELSTRGNSERRGWVRFPFTAAAEIAELHSETRVVGRCSDLGSGGCYIDTLSPFAVGSAVRVRIERDLLEFQAEATVTYALASMGMGLVFTGIKAEDRGVLHSWIAELSGEMAPKVEASYTGLEAGLLSVNVEKILNDLINLMVRRKLITETEATGLLRQMLR